MSVLLEIIIIHLNSIIEPNKKMKLTVMCLNKIWKEFVVSIQSRNRTSSDFQKSEWIEDEINNLQAISNWLEM